MDDVLFTLCMIVAAFLAGMLWGHRLARINFMEILKVMEKKPDVDNADWWKRTGEEQ